MKQTIAVEVSETRKAQKSQEAHSQSYKQLNPQNT